MQPDPKNNHTNLSVQITQHPSYTSDSIRITVSKPTNQEANYEQN